MLRTTHRLVLPALLLLGGIELLGGAGPLHAQPAVSECGEPRRTLVGDGFERTETLTVDADVTVGELTVALDLETPSVALWFNISIESPSGTVVQLHRREGDGEDFDLIYSDTGRPNDAIPTVSSLGLPSVYDCAGRCRFTPTGPIEGEIGSLADFDGESSEGDWTLSLRSFVGGRLEKWCVEVHEVAALESATCTPVGDEIEVRVTPAEDLDSVSITLDGVAWDEIPGPLLAGEEATLTALAGTTLPGVVELELFPEVSGTLGASTLCEVVLLPEPAAEVEITPAVEVSLLDPPYVGTLLFVDDVEIGDLQLDFEATVFDPGAIEVNLASLSGTVVTVHDRRSHPPDFALTYWENGQPFASAVDGFTCNCLMRPSGPGQLSDFVGENTVDPVSGVGVWVVTVENVAVLPATVDRVALRVFDTPTVFQVTSFGCQAGSGLGTVDVSWINSSDYDSIEIRVNDVLETTLTGGFTAGVAESYTTLPLPLPSQAYVEVRGVIAGVSSPAESCALDIGVDPVVDLACVKNAAAEEIDVSWEDEVGYDEINVYVDGALVSTLDGAATSTTVDGPFTIPGPVEIEIEGVVTGVGTSERARCRHLFDVEADLEVCEAPLTSIPALGTVVEEMTIADTFSIDEVEVFVDVTTTFIDSWRIDLESPGGTEVRLHNFDATLAEDMFVLFADDGIVHDVPYVCGCRMRVADSGGLAAFEFEGTLGTWELSMFTVNDVVGTLNSWCIRAFGCPRLPPIGVDCTAAGSVVTLTWFNQDNYDEIDIVEGDEVIATVDGIETSAELTLGEGRHVLRVVGRDDALGCSTSSTVCAVAVGFEQFCTSDITVDLDTVTTVTVDEPLVVDEVEVFLDYTFAFAADTADLTAPDGVSVRLHEDPFVTGRIHVLYSDEGVENGAPYDCGGCRMQPSGPGVLADFLPGEFEGEWSFQLLGTISSARIEEWCLLTRLAPPDGGNEFLRGDADGSGTVFCLIDALFLLEWGFQNGPAPECLDAADIDDNGTVFPLVDALACLQWQFTGGPPPPSPGPSDCGADPDGSDDGVSCATPSEGCDG